MQIFLDFAPNYFAHMERCQQTKQPTLLGKIVGVYRVSFKNNTTNAALRTSVLVMENLFYNRTITDKFDLKGSVRNRLVNPDETCHEGELVLLDENLLNSTYSCDRIQQRRMHRVHRESMLFLRHKERANFAVSCDSPLYIRSHSKAVLNRAIEQDTKFLADNSVMDYSLLVGLEPSSDELVLGIIGKRAVLCARIMQLNSSYGGIIARVAHLLVIPTGRLHTNVHLGQKARDDGEEVRHTRRTG